jgi:hypothetical protein
MSPLRGLKRSRSYVEFTLTVAENANPLPENVNPKPEYRYLITENSNPRRGHANLKREHPVLSRENSKRTLAQSNLTREKSISMREMSNLVRENWNLRAGIGKFAGRREQLSREKRRPLAMRTPLFYFNGTLLA